MNFLTALSAYHEGKRIRRYNWDERYTMKKTDSILISPCNDSDQDWVGRCVEWKDILADDWIAEAPE